MDFLNKTFAQFSDIFRSMTSGARITAGLLLAVVVISLVYLFSYQMSPSGVYLMNGQSFKPEEFRRIQAALGAKNLSCESDGMKIKIPAGREADYMAALAEGNAIPVGWGDQDGSIANGSVFEDPDTRKRRAKAALEKKLSFWVSNLPNVENAEVTYDKSTTGGFRKKVSICASVIVQPTSDNMELSKRAVASIRSMVASAISPMSPKDVTVVNTGTGTSYAADNEADHGNSSNEYLEATRNWEEDFHGKISNILADYDGVKVAITVRLNETKSKATTTYTPDKTMSATVTSSTKNIKRKNEGPVPAGRPGLSSNRPAAIRATTGRGSLEDTSENEEMTQNLIGQKSENEVFASFMPEWFSASVVVPHSHLARIWKQKNPPAEGTDFFRVQIRPMRTIKQCNQ